MREAVRAMRLCKAQGDRGATTAAAATAAAAIRAAWVFFPCRMQTGAAARTRPLAPSGLVANLSREWGGDAVGSPYRRGMGDGERRCRGRACTGRGVRAPISVLSAPHPPPFLLPRQKPLVAALCCPSTTGTRRGLAERGKCKAAGRRGADCRVARGRQDNQTVRTHRRKIGRKDEKTPAREKNPPQEPL